MDRHSQAVVAPGASSCEQLLESALAHRRKAPLGSWVAVPKAAAFCLRHTTGNQAGPAGPEEAA